MQATDRLQFVNFYKPTNNLQLVGRQYEQALLKEISQKNEASIVVVYGRRRVGKTELIEQCFKSRNLIKFEGIEGKDPQYQIDSCLQQISFYSKNRLLNYVACKSWREFFTLITPALVEGEVTLYLEELQWLANYETELISELKYFWDNYLRHNKRLIIVLCGSSPSFMVNKVLLSKALYNRSQHELYLKPFSIKEAAEFMGSGYTSRDIFDAYLTLGGIPEYLKQIRSKLSVLQALCNNSFKSGGFFVNEEKRVFVSTLASSPHYKDIIRFLSKRKYATRADLLKHIKVDSGGGISSVFSDLEQCEFIESYSPYFSKAGSVLKRYSIKDNYLNFYYKFVKPIDGDISNGKFNQNPIRALNPNDYKQWLGFAFERFCRNNRYLLAKLLGFEDVDYKSGAYFQRGSGSKDEKSGFQIDLIFERKDRINTIAEIKYQLDPVGNEVVEEFEKKIKNFNSEKNYRIQKVLISANGQKEALKNQGYFDKVVTLEDILST